jgi:DNA polymerase III subunit beta
MTATEVDFGTIGAAYEAFSFTIKVPVLAELCRDAARVVPSTDFQPLLKSFKVEVGPSEVRLAATDMDLAVVASSPAVSAEAEASVVLPARRLMDILATLYGGDIAFAIHGDRADITAGSAKWSLRLVDGSDYPALPVLSELELQPVDREKLLAALLAVRHAIGHEHSRHNLQQVVIADAGGKRVMTACDSARLARVPAEFPFPAAVPRGAVEELIRLLDRPGGDLSAAEGDGGTLVFKFGDTVFTTQPPPSKFPNVEAQLLKPAVSNHQALGVSRLLLAEAIRRVRVTADESTNAIALRLSEGKCEVVSNDKGGNRASQALDASWDGAERTVVVSWRHLADLLAVLQGETVTLLLGPGSGKKPSPVLCEDSASGLTAVVSQMLGSVLGY